MLIRLLALLTLVVSSACGRVPPLDHTYPSREAVGAAVLEALARADRAALQALAVTEAEFRDHVWPQLPAARPERNLPLSYVWGGLHQKSEQHLTETLARHGGRRYEQLSVKAAGQTTAYKGHLIHRDTIVTVRDDQGVTRELRLFGSTIEKGGRWKVFSYVVAD